MALTQEQQAAINSANERIRSGSQPVESQKARSFAQGVSFGFSDEIEAFLRNLGGESGTYEQIRDRIRNDLRAYQEANPTEAIGIETIGAIAPTALSLLSGVGSGAGVANIGRLARAGTSVIPTAATLGGRLPRFAQGAATGAAYGGLYGLGTAEGDLGERISRAGEVAQTGALFGAGGQAVLRTIGLTTKPFIGLFKSTDTPSSINNISSKVKTLAQQAYKELDKSKQRIPVSVVQKLLDDSKLNATKTYNYVEGMPKASSRLQDLTTDGFDDIQALINRSKETGSISISDLYDLQRRINGLYRSSLRGDNVQQLALKDTSDNIDEIVKNLGDDGELWQNAKNLWRTQKNFERIENAFDEASRSVEAGVNRDAATVYKNMANRILNSKDINYFLPQEQQLFREFVKGNFVDNLLQAIGTYAPSSGNFMRILAIGGAFTSGGLTLPFTMFAQLAKNSSNKKIVESANNLIAEMARGNPQVLAEIQQAMPSMVSPRPPVSGRASSPLAEEISQERGMSSGLTSQQQQVIDAVNARLGQ